MPRDLSEFREIALRRLGEFEHTEVMGGLRHAAVVLCVMEQDGVPGVVVIKRAYRGRNAGQWALPGGRLDPGETPEEAALRELHEELGLRVDAVLGRLDDFPASSGFTITPIVVTASGTMTPSPDEVHSAHHVPLSKLAGEDVVRWTQEGLLQMALGPRMTIHAPTGALLWQFREVVLLGRHTRVAEVGQPDWTRR